MADLTGKWSCDDQGIYYVRQLGNSLYWYGERKESSPDWANVFVGNIEGTVIRGTWVDVPKGRGAGQGQISLAVHPDGKSFVATQKTGGFGGSNWKRVIAQPAPRLPTPPAQLSVVTCPGAGRCARVGWSLPPQFDAFEVQRATDSGTGQPPAEASYTNIGGSIHADSFEDRSLTSDGIYWYRVRAVVGSQRSAFTPPQPFEAQTIVT